MRRARSTTPATRRPCEAVYLLHGFGARPMIMTRLARFLRQRDYAIRNWGYNTLRRTIAAHAGDLLEEVQRVADSGEFLHVHFVAHSLGSIVVRHAFCEARPSIVGRVVMLAPPNGGSHFARAGSVVLGRLCPVLKELSSCADSYVNRLGVPRQLEVGVIAASDDWVVRRRNTHLASERDHIVVRGDHVRLPLLHSCAQQTLSFLETGSFRHTGERQNGCESSDARQKSGISCAAVQSGVAPRAARSSIRSINGTMSATDSSV